MLQVARLAPTLLGDSRELVSGFFHRSLNPDGGFADRAGDSDLYYTVFGLEGLLAVHEPLPDSTAAYLQRFGSGETLDFVHLTCLARAWGSLSRTGPPSETSSEMESRLAGFQSADGGFAVSPGSATGSAYACVLAMGA